MVLDEEMEQAALKIQSTFRGHKTRQDIKKDDNEKVEAEEPKKEKSEVDNIDDDVANMVLDEEMEQAALKIQSTFRGHKTRKDIKKDETDVDTEEVKNEDDVETEDVEKEKEEEEPKKQEEEPEQSSSSNDKTAKQLQDEEDIGRCPKFYNFLITNFLN
jgi:uridine phosphorylase